MGYTPTAIQTHDQVSNTINIEGILSVAGVSREDIAADCFNGVQIFVFEVIYENLSQDIDFSVNACLNENLSNSWIYKRS